MLPGTGGLYREYAFMYMYALIANGRLKGELIVSIDTNYGGIQITVIRGVNFYSGLEGSNLLILFLYLIQSSNGTSSD